MIVGKSNKGAFSHQEVAKRVFCRAQKNVHSPLYHCYAGQYSR